MTSRAAEAATRYQRTFHGRAEQVRQVRADIGRYLGGCPAVADVVLVASELSANAVLHSASGGEFFTVRCEQHAGYVWVEVEDLGGPWLRKPPGDRPHGLDITAALAGPDGWGTETTSDGNRIVWARLDIPSSSGDGLVLGARALAWGAFYDLGHGSGTTWTGVRKDGRGRVLSGDNPAALNAAIRADWMRGGMA